MIIKSASLYSNITAAKTLILASTRYCCSSVGRNNRTNPPPPQNEKQKQMREKFWIQEKAIESQVILVFGYM